MDAKRNVLDPFLEEKGMSLTDLSKKIPISLPWLSKINRGIAKNPSFEALGLIADGIGFEPKIIFPEKAKEIAVLAATWNV